ncbi:JmjC domain protein [Ostertagia ostertagi]
MFYTRCERRVTAAQNKDRPDLAKVGWDSLNYAKNFKLPPLEDKMVRVNGKTTTVDEFREKYEKPRVPCVITDLTDKWKAHENWTIKARYHKLYKLSQRFGNSYFKCGETPKGQSVFLKFKYFSEYMRENEDDSPLYIFDEYFAQNRCTKQILDDYEVPRFFSDDLFEILGTNMKRPPYRWLWLQSSDTPNELVHVPKDQCGIYPKEAVTWFSTVYKRIRQGDWPFDKYPVYECRQNPGETLFVPCGWWHAVINEDDTVAITQNFCSPTNLFHVYPTIRKQRPGLDENFP